MSALAGIDDSPSLLPGSVGAALVGNATCACSAAPGLNAELAALEVGASLMDVDGWGWLRRWMLQRHVHYPLNFCHPAFVVLQ